MANQNRTWFLMSSQPNYTTKKNLDQYFSQSNDDLFTTLCVISLLVGNILAGIPSTIYSRQFGPSAWNSLMLISWAVIEFLNLLFQSETLFWMSRLLIGGVVSWFF